MNNLIIIKMKVHSYIFSLLACISIALPGYSQVDRNETLIRSALHGLEYEIKAGFSIGGTAPLPLPVEIRSVDGYNPTLAISIGGIPKTIDNDIAMVDRSFGFETAVQECTRAIRSALVEVMSCEYGVGIVKLMGREAGFIAGRF